MSEQKLRSLLAEAVPLNTPCPSCLRTIEEERRGYGREGCTDTARRLLVDAALAEPVSVIDWKSFFKKAEQERDEARAEVERMKARITEVGVMVAKNGNGMAGAAYQRGAEAMREAAAQGLDRLLTQKKATAIWVGPDEIRALPIPEDEP